MRIAVVDHVAKDRKELISKLTRYFHSNNVRADLDEFSCAEPFLKQFVPNQFAAVFLEIDLEGTNGMETAKKVYELDPYCRLIFYTATEAYAVESYSVRAAYYLIKPLLYETLARALDLVGAPQWEKNNRLTIHVKAVELCIALRNILYVDCVSRQVCVHMAKKIYLADESISVLSDLLCQDNRFLCCNRNVYINMDQVDAITIDSFQMSNQELVPMRHRGKSALKKKFTEYSLKMHREEEAAMR